MPPVFAHGQLRLYLLALLAESPRHGYEIIKALTDRFGGTYRPSPGTIYPRLSALETDGLITREDSGRKAVFRITEAGRAELEARAEELQATETSIADTVRARADALRMDTAASMSELRQDLDRAEREAHRQAGATPPRRQDNWWEGWSDRWVEGLGDAADILSEAASGIWSEAVFGSRSAEDAGASDPASADRGTAGPRETDGEGDPEGASDSPAPWSDTEERARRARIARDTQKVLLGQAEVTLTTFRARARAALRAAAARGELTEDRLETLRTATEAVVRDLG